MAELDVQVITANSPEAKGRVERLFGTLQDRMVKEIRLASMQTRDDANLYIYETYIPDHNRRFGVRAKCANDVHRSLPDEMRKNLPSIFSIQSKRRIRNDYTIQYKTEWYQLEAQQKITLYKRDEVIIEEWLDGTIHIRFKDAYLKFRELPGRPKPTFVPVVALTAQEPAWKPPRDHPWRKSIP